MNRPKPTSSVKRQIDENLKRAFDEIAQEEVPDRFTQLLSELRSAEGKVQSKKDQHNDA